MKSTLCTSAGLGLLVAALAACSPSAPPAETSPEIAEQAPDSATYITGIVTLPANATLPPDAIVKIDLRAPAEEAGAPIPILSETLSADSGPPYEFRLKLPEDISDTTGLVVFARAQQGVAILFNNLEGAPVFAPATHLSLPLTSTENWGSAGAGDAVTPIPILYSCNATPVAIALEAATAYLTVDGGETMNLPLLDRTPEGVRQYSNGKFVVQVEQNEYGAQTVSLAQGRAAIQPCTK